MHWEHMGKTVEVTTRGEFLVKELGEVFGTLEEAKKGIEDEAKLEDINLLVLYGDGQRGLVAKVHHGTGRFIVKDGDGRTVDRYGADVYFPCPDAEKLCAERREARLRLHELEAQLKAYKVELPHAYQYGVGSHKSPTEAQQMHQEALKAYEKLRESFGGSE